MLYNLLSIMRRGISVEIRNCISGELYVEESVAGLLECPEYFERHPEVRNAEVIAWEENQDYNHIIIYIDA